MAVKFTQTYKTYEDAAAEARRAQAMADMLQQQAYQPIQMDTAGPVSYTQGLAKMLQAYLAGKEGRKAREAEAESKRLGREEFKDYISAFEPERATTPVEMVTAPRSLQQRMELKPQDIDLGQIAQGMGTPTISEQGAMGYTPPTGKLPSAGPMEFTTGALTPAQRRAKILEGMGSGNPMVQAIAQAEYTKKPEIEEFGTTPVKGEGGRYYLVSKTGRMVPTNVGVPPEEMTPYQREQLDLDRKRLDLESRKVRAAGDLTVGDRFKNENTLRDEYLAQTAPFRTVQDAYSKIKSTSDTGPGDMSLLYSYVKLLDPGSVVRESEFATAAQSGSFGQRVQGAVQQIMSGQRLSPTLRKGFREEADKIYEAQKENATRVGSKYRDLAKSYSLDPSRVVVEYAQPEAARPDSVFLPQQPANPFAPQQPAFSAPLPARIGGYYK